MLFSLRHLTEQYQACRRHKRNTVNALRFEARQELNLLDLQHELRTRTYTPTRSVCFFVRRPKLREVFAADFRDRVVHHVLVSHLEPIWERVFIHDSFACRTGKGVHAGVERLQTFLRQATANGTRPAWYMQLDVRNCFMSIDHQVLWRLLQSRLPAQAAPGSDHDNARWLAHTLVFHDCTQGAIKKGNPATWANVPPHKSLYGVVPQGKGLPIGNLTSQFFANVYLNGLDQFVKHTLKCRWYVRYCDDFVLLAESPQQLLQWRERIRAYLHEHLQLALNDGRERIRPISDGVDFLGYVLRPSHRLVRRRVVGHCTDKLLAFEQQLVAHEAGPGGVKVTTYRFDADVLDALQACLASYLGHFRPAAAHRLCQRLWQRFDWLGQYFVFAGLGQPLRRRDAPPRTPMSLFAQYRHWCQAFPGDEVWIQNGHFAERLRWPPRGWRQGKAGADEQADAQAGAWAAPPRALRPMRANRRGAQWGLPLDQLERRLMGRVAQGISVLWVASSPSVQQPVGQANKRVLWRKQTHSTKLPEPALVKT